MPMGRFTIRRCRILVSGPLNDAVIEVVDKRETGPFTARVRAA